MMPKHMPGAHARSNARGTSASNAMRLCSELCTDGRTDVLTEKHLTLWDEGSSTYRVRAQNDFPLQFGFALLAHRANRVRTIAERRAA